MLPHKTTVALFIALISLAGGCSMTPATQRIPNIPAPRIPDGSFSLKDYGAAPDGKTNNTKAFADAIAACAKAGGGTVIVPAGTYFTGPIQLTSNMNLHLDDGATILFSNKPEDFPVGGFAPLPDRHQSLITITNGHDIMISGKGTIDGQGEPWWADFRAHRRDSGFVERRPKMIVFDNCQRVRVEGVTLTNSPMFHMSPTQSSDIVVDGVTVKAPAKSPNTDSFNPSGWNILLQNCTFDVGDDNVAVKPFIKPGDGRLSCENIYIHHCRFLHGHGLSIGGQTPGGLRNMHVWDCTFENTENGIRLKAERGFGGLVENITYEDITMTNVGVPVMVTSYYHGLPPVGQRDSVVSAVNDTTPVWKDIHLSNITATGAKDAGLLMGLPEKPISDVTLSNVKIAAGKPMRIGNAVGLKFDNVTIDVPGGKPFVIEENVQGEGLPSR